MNGLVHIIEQPGTLEALVLRIAGLERIAALLGRRAVIERTNHHTVEVTLSVEHHQSGITVVRKLLLHALCIGLHAKSATNYAEALQGSVARYHRHLLLTCTNGC